MKTMTIPEGIHPDIFDLCIRLTQKPGPVDEMGLAADAYKALAAQYRNGDLPAAMAELGVGTRDELMHAIQLFLDWRELNPPSEPLDEDDEADEPQGDWAPDHNEIAQSSISDTTLFVIDNVVKRTRVTDRYEVMERLCDVIEHRFGTGAKLEENLKKLHLATTKEVLKAIDIYFIMKDLYPDTVFGRKRMQAVWAPVFQECFPEEEVS